MNYYIIKGIFPSFPVELRQSIMNFLMINDEYSPHNHHHYHYVTLLSLILKITLTAISLSGVCNKHYFDENCDKCLFFFYLALKGPVGWWPEPYISL